MRSCSRVSYELADEDRLSYLDSLNRSGTGLCDGLRIWIRIRLGAGMAKSNAHTAETPPMRKSAVCASVEI
jgi:hypothetical protein